MKQDINKKPTKLFWLQVFLFLLTGISLFVPIVTHLFNGVFNDTDFIRVIALTWVIISAGYWRLNLKYELMVGRLIEMYKDLFFEYMKVSIEQKLPSLDNLLQPIKNITKKKIVN